MRYGGGQTEFTFLGYNRQKRVACDKRLGKVLAGMEVFMYYGEPTVPAKAA